MKKPTATPKPTTEQIAQLALAWKTLDDETDRLGYQLDSGEPTPETEELFDAKMIDLEAAKQALRHALEDWQPEAPR